jgi:hypothetical protein
MASFFLFFVRSRAEIQRDFSRFFLQGLSVVFAAFLASPACSSSVSTASQQDIPAPMSVVRILSRSLSMLLRGGTHFESMIVDLLVHTGHVCSVSANTSSQSMQILVFDIFIIPPYGCSFFDT